MKRREMRILFAAMIAAVVFAGCGAKKQEEAAVTATETPAEETPEETEAPEETPEATETPTPEAKKKITMYTLSNTALRKEESGKSEVLEKLVVNTKVKVLEEKDKFCYVKVNGKKGYVLAKKLTKSEKKALKAEKKMQEKEAAALAKAEEEKKAAEEQAAADRAAAEQAAAEQAAAEQAAAEQAAWEAEQAAQQAQDSSANYSNSEGTQGESGGNASSERVVVSEERYDDCDGSGHGYKVIHYSDGTEETVEY